MELRALGASGLKVSVIGLGAMGFGDVSGTFMEGCGCDERTAFELLDCAREAGVNLIDTADVYGRGDSERVVGRWLADRGCRDEMVIATKLGLSVGDGPNDYGASRLHIQRAAEASLRRLGVDAIDLYQLYMQDPETPAEEALRALDDLTRQGKVRYVGCSNYAAYRLVDSLWRSRSQGRPGFVTLQAQYNLLCRSIEREHLPACSHLGLGLLAYGPLAAGFLTGKLARGAEPGPGTRLALHPVAHAAAATERGWRVLDALRALSERTGASCAQLALAWLMGRPQVSAALVGARSVAQLRENLGALRCPLGPADRRALDAASGPALDHPYDLLERTLGCW